ncbi:hypothetical protein HanRHA438_Chr07g0309601 [Helianthus annuus]|uniref:Uncharacterized protein n=1 Tax=Helianthus annuus TaxID=4232 RepID=A0A251UV75_HELAN|nr:hypothetical protein HanXRQr2_Chr07g0299351 [Helianthus annuus]KAJ0557258.1 hypothetical protein HanIR_Chr07g0323131 [Helianthus annuus]KAJ0905077.1 hypothetical protein HanPSC8_Chr07g0289831 [Helianthus annuus]KAJ0908362.1 hypothetical protein HanRHA438_Chr07g0309601 [Helianthus annuus]
MLCSHLLQVTLLESLIMFKSFLSMEGDLGQQAWLWLWCQCFCPIKGLDTLCNNQIEYKNGDKIGRMGKR